MPVGAYAHIRSTLTSCKQGQRARQRRQYRICRIYPLQQLGQCVRINLMRGGLPSLSLGNRQLCTTFAWTLTLNRLAVVNLNSMRLVVVDWHCKYQQLTPAHSQEWTLVLIPQNRWKAALVLILWSRSANATVSGRETSFLLHPLFLCPIRHQRHPL